MRKKILFLFLLLSTSSVFSQTTYNDVATIFYENCGTCHRPNGGAPFSLSNYAETSAWASTIHSVVSNKTMPPWSADTAYLHFSNERVLTLSEYDAILAWVNDGAIEGDPNLLPPPPTYPNYLINGTPDLILHSDTFLSNANNIDTYNTIVVPTGLTQDRYIKGVEIIPNNAALMHHVLFNADSSGAVPNDFTGTSFSIQGSIEIGIYVPGANPLLFPNSSELKLGIKIPKNADMVLQIHTPKGTAGLPINAEIRLFLYPVGEPGIRDITSNTILQHWGSNFWFLPGETKTISTEAPSLPTDISIYSSLPHSHQICTDILNYAYNPNGTETIPLMLIDNWDFEHQEYYYYKNLVKIPANYVFRSEHIYANTSSNPNNPFSPPQFITVGTASTDEMLFDTFQYTDYQVGDELINVDSILNNDPLLNSFSYSGINGIKTKIKPSYIYPNPLIDQSSIYFYHPHQIWGNYSLRIWTMDGKLVELSTQLNNGVYTIEKGNTKSGYYVYEILDGGILLTSGTIVVQ